MKRIIYITALMLIMCLMFSAVSVSAYVDDEDVYMHNILSNIDSTYEDEIMSHFYPELFKGQNNIWIYYNMLYAHDEATLSKPEYVVFKALTGCGEPASSRRYFGDYRVFSDSMDYPYELGYYVYVPAKQKVYTLEEAWESEELDISKAFESGRIGIHRADVNLDGSCDILDATYTQMYLAGVEGFKSNGRMNFNTNDNINITDVTALQRYLAGIEV
ncbi:MAG: dockerin type I repeat-containing protein [Ruminococcus sp.]|nr:dockerin type I repeat-containing protein [Ruminococcus sp.]